MPLTNSYLIFFQLFRIHGFLHCIFNFETIGIFEAFQIYIIIPICQQKTKQFGAWEWVWGLGPGWKIRTIRKINKKDMYFSESLKKSSFIQKGIFLFLALSAAVSNFDRECTTARKSRAKIVVCSVYKKFCRFCIITIYYWLFS